MQNLNYNHRNVTLKLQFDRRRGIHYIRYSLPYIKLDDGTYKARRFRKDEPLRFLFNEGYNYTHHTDRNGNHNKLNALQRSQNKKYMKRCREVMSERQVDISRGDYQIPSKSTADCFFDYLERHRNNPRKAYSYQTKCAYNSLEKHLRGFHKLNTLPFELFDSAWVDKFHGYLISDAHNDKRSSGGRLGGVTILKRIKDLKYIVGRAVIDKVIPYHPFGEYEIYEKGKTPKSRFGDWLEPEELKLMSENPLPYKSTYDMFMFMCNSGMAFAEAYVLKWGDITDLETYSTIKYTRKKTGKMRTLQISKQARQYLGERGIADVRVFDITGNVDDINKRLQMWAKMLGINKHLTCHAGKRTFAYCLYKKTKDIFALQQLLGHNDLKSTQRYVNAFQIDTTAVMTEVTLSGGLF
tara:strand:+ start:549 stop:1778 length:1230 start_codon:yes stop_codon:yes gene_type:complete